MVRQWACDGPPTGSRGRCPSRFPAYRRPGGVAVFLVVESARDALLEQAQLTVECGLPLRRRHRHQVVRAASKARRTKPYPVEHALDQPQLVVLVAEVPLGKGRSAIWRRQSCSRFTTSTAVVASFDAARIHRGDVVFAGGIHEHPGRDRNSRGVELLHGVRPPVREEVATHSPRRRNARLRPPCLPTSRA